jgi:hypothetical protein
VKILVAEVAFHERRTQWREAYKERLMKTKAGLDAILQTSLMPHEVKTQIQSAINALPAVSSADDLSTKVFESAFSEH